MLAAIRLLRCTPTNNTAGATKANPTTTDGKGFYSFYAADGQYVLEFNNGFPSLEVQLVDVDAIRNDFDALELSNAAFRNEQQAAYDAFVLSQGWDQVGTFAAGFTYTSPNQVGQDADGNWWRWNGVLPKTVTAGTLPSSDANYKLVGDGVLRSELAAPDSTALVGGVEAGVLVSRSSFTKNVVSDYGAVAGVGIDATAAFQAMHDELGYITIPATETPFEIGAIVSTRPLLMFEINGVAKIKAIAIANPFVVTTTHPNSYISGNIHFDCNNTGRGAVFCKYWG